MPDISRAVAVVAQGLQNEARGASVSDMLCDWLDGAGGCNMLPGELHRGGKHSERSKIAGKLLSGLLKYSCVEQGGRGVGH